MATDPAPDVDSKFILASRTIIGALVMLLPMVLGWCGLQFDSAAAQQLGDNLLSLVGAALVVYGRIAATKRISFRVTPPGVDPRLPAAAIFLAPVAVVIALYLSACSADGKFKMPELKARVCRTNADGTKICAESDGKSVTLAGELQARSADGKTTLEFGTR